MAFGMLMKEKCFWPQTTYKNQTGESGHSPCQVRRSRLCALLTFRKSTHQDRVGIDTAIPSHSAAEPTRECDKHPVELTAAQQVGLPADYGHATDAQTRCLSSQCHSSTRPSAPYNNHLDSYTKKHLPSADTCDARPTRRHHCLSLILEKPLNESAYGDLNSLPPFRFPTSRATRQSRLEDARAKLVNKELEWNQTLLEALDDRRDSHQEAGSFDDQFSLEEYCEPQELPESTVPAVLEDSEAPPIDKKMLSLKTFYEKELPPNVTSMTIVRCVQKKASLDI